MNPLPYDTTRSDAQNVTCRYDDTVKAMYCNYRPRSKGDVAKTVEMCENPLTLYDYDKDGNLLGIETLQ